MQIMHYVNMEIHFTSIDKRRAGGGCRRGDISAAGRKETRAPRRHPQTDVNTL